MKLSNVLLRSTLGLELFWGIVAIKTPRKNTKDGTTNSFKSDNLTVQCASSVRWLLQKWTLLWKVLCMAHEYPLCNLNVVCPTWLHAKCAQCRLLTYEVPCCRPDMGDARGKHMDLHSFIPFRHQQVIWLFLICQHKNHHWCWTKKIPVDLHHAWLDGTRLWRNLSSQILFWGYLISIDCCYMDHQMQSMQWQAQHINSLKAQISSSTGH